MTKYFFKATEDKLNIINLVSDVKIYCCEIIIIMIILINK